MKILLVEDEEILIKVLQEKFEQGRFSVTLAMDGESATRLAKSAHPDLIVLDLILPKKSGFDVLKELKADPQLQKIPVIVLSNLGQDEEIKQALAAGAVDYLVKTQHPINEVVEKVRNYLVRKK